MAGSFVLNMNSFREIGSYIKACECVELIDFVVQSDAPWTNEIHCDYVVALHGGKCP
jgi:hypothetical protein